VIHLLQINLKEGKRVMLGQLGRFGDQRLDRCGSDFLERMIGRKSTCLRQLAGGRRSDVVRFGRFLANPRVTVDRLIRGWGEHIGSVCSGRHILAIQDTSEINFRTTATQRRGLGKIGKGVGHGLLLHAMLAVDADTFGCLGLVSGRIWTRSGLRSIPHSKRPLTDKESGRWLNTSAAAKEVLRNAAMVTVVADRESDIYAEWARIPASNFHLLTRAMQDRVILEGGHLSTADLALAGDTQFTIRAQPGRPERRTTLRMRFGQVTIKRPHHTLEKGLPEAIPLRLVEVMEVNPPKDCKPIMWRLLTTHEVIDGAQAWQIVEWYRQRWIIEQFFRILKQQGLRLEDSQLGTAEGLLKLTAVAALAACTTLQLVQARNGHSAEQCDVAFTSSEIRTLEKLHPRVEGSTAAQKNPHHLHSLAWASWIIAKLGGWDGYKSSRPPGPITLKNGLQQFTAISYGDTLTDV